MHTFSKQLGYKVHVMQMLHVHVQYYAFRLIVHFGGGSWGLIAVAFFDSKEGILYAGNLKSGYVSISICFLDSVTSSIFISHKCLYLCVQY